MVSMTTCGNSRALARLVQGNNPTGSVRFTAQPQRLRWITVLQARYEPSPEVAAR